MHHSTLTDKKPKQYNHLINWDSSFYKLKHIFYPHNSLALYSHLSKKKGKHDQKKTCIHIYIEDLFVLAQTIKKNFQTPN